jgi:hypothetical protein
MLKALDMCTKSSTLMLEPWRTMLRILIELPHIIMSRQETIDPNRPMLNSDMLDPSRDTALIDINEPSSTLSSTDRVLPRRE